MNNRQKFESCVMPQDLVRGEDGKYANFTVQYAWLICNHMLNKEAPFHIVDAAAAAGAEALRGQCISRLAAERERTGLSQMSFAGHLGVSDGHLSTILNHKASVSLEKLLRLVAEAAKLPSKAPNVVTRRNDAEVGLAQLPPQN